jgi:hypothetical protein
MPEYDDNYESDDDTTPEDDEGIRGVRKAKNAAEARAKEAERQLAEANIERREYAAVKAGLDPQSKQAQFFLTHYDGEPTAEAIKTAAIDAGIIDDGTEASQAAAAAQQQMAAAFGGGEGFPVGTQPIGPDGMQVPAEEVPMWKEFEDRVKNGDFAGGAQVLRKFGHGVAETAGHEMLVNGPQTQPYRP